MSGQGKYRKWTAEQKLEIVLAALRGDRSVRDVCREHSISETLSTSAHHAIHGGAPGEQRIVLVVEPRNVIHHIDDDDPTKLLLRVREEVGTLVRLSGRACCCRGELEPCCGRGWLRRRWPPSCSIRVPSGAGPELRESCKAPSRPDVPLEGLG